jgi:mRNA interferase RelE/StbE
MYEVLLTRRAQAVYEQAETTLVRRLNRSFDQISQTPYSHPNIKRLGGTLAGQFRYRVGDWRVIYTVDEEYRTVTILLIVHRSQAYR